MGFFDKIMDDVLGDPFGSYHQADVARQAGEQQARYAEEGVEEQRRQFDYIKSVLEPYMRAGRYGMYGLPEGGLSEREMYGTKNPFAQQVSGMTQQQIQRERDRISREGGDPMYKAALEAVRAGQDPTWAGSEYSDQPVEAGGVFQFAQAGEEALPILQQFAQTGGDALTAQRALTGLEGADAQAQAIEMLKGTPEYEMLVREGEQALLQNASATGGVRGGNTAGMLSELRPGLLVDMINRKYAQYGGLAGAGGNVASSLASNAQNVYGNLMNVGQASASGAVNTAQGFGANAAKGLNAIGAYMGGAMNAGAQGAGSGLSSLVNAAGDVAKVAGVFL